MRVGTIAFGAIHAKLAIDRTRLAVRAIVAAVRGSVIVVGDFRRMRESAIRFRAIAAKLTLRSAVVAGCRWRVIGHFRQMSKFTVRFAAVTSPLAVRKRISFIVAAVGGRM
jgi:hypothetical protein